MRVGTSNAGYEAPNTEAQAAPAMPTDDEVREYLPLVRKVARRLAFRKPPNVELDELISWGLSGLLDAMQKYDPSKRATFETYAQLRIRGAILDRLRSQDWAARSVRQKANKLERAYQVLESRLGRPATEEEVAGELSITLPELHSLLSEVGQRTMLSLEDIGFEAGGVDAEGFLSGDSSDPMQTILRGERVQLVARAISRLPEKERMVVALYYREGITMREVGAVMELTESRVSQLHSQAILRLRGFLGEHFGGEK